ncbi:MAG: TonB-dependent receptor [Bacteroidia bacterium]|nr:TonB-dependent receptor [Bacteroidia bacterium]
MKKKQPLTNLFLGISFLAFTCFQGFAQESTLRGKIIDRENHPVVDALIRIYKIDKVWKSAADGHFSLSVPPGNYQIIITHINFFSETLDVHLPLGATLNRNFILTANEKKLEGVDIIDKPNTTKTQENPFLDVLPIDPKKIVEIPTPKSDIESKLVTMPGVVSNNEFSSQYRVRGGNFDENLIYVNDIEIYRPQMIRSGQQEGLGFSNAELISNAAFSTGGFEARFGDKLSSVLNLTYNKPKQFRGSAEVGILTTNLHLEGSSKNKKDPESSGKFTYLIGLRRYSTQYLIKSLDTQGDYHPSFYDGQLFLTYVPKPRKHSDGDSGTSSSIERLKISYLLAASRNRFQFIPQNRETTFGTFQQAFRLFVAFEGKEITQYLTGQTALLVEYRPTYRYNLKFIASGFQTQEAEVFTTEGGYRLSDINTNFGSKEFGEEVFVRGIGTYLNHARNYLNASVVYAEHKGEYYLNSNLTRKILWGVRAQQEWIADELKEWTATDSSDYVKQQDYIQTQNNLTSQRLMGYTQLNWRFHESLPLRVMAGVRANYWTLNHELTISPRLQAVWEPVLRDSLKQLQLRAAVGTYVQPPFYREMRSYAGTVNTSLQAQKSTHFILGGDYVFRLWRRNFKVFSELYYKKLTDIVPYEVDNVRIRYLATNSAVGYAYGWDNRINGEFIRGIDSWLTVSYLKTEEDLSQDTRGYIRRPSDQRVTVGFYFQDELPRNPTFKVHVNLVYGSGLPFGPPKNLFARNQFSAPAYRRVDLGFSKLLLFKTREERGKLGVESLWLSAEIFNLFGVNNTVSYLWIKDVYNTQIAIPNYLSARLINVRMVVRF